MPFIGPFLLAAVLAVLAFGPCNRADASQMEARGLDCPAYYFCLWEEAHPPGGEAIFFKQGIREWRNLARWNWANDAEAMRNSRHKIVMLAGQRDGNGVRYCAQGDSVDSSLWDNAINGDNAESFKMVYSDRRC